MGWAGGPRPWSTPWIPSWSRSAASPPLLEVAGDRVQAGYRDGLMGARAGVAPPLASSTLGGRAPLVGAGEHAFDHILTDRALAAWSAT